MFFNDEKFEQLKRILDQIKAHLTAHDKHLEAHDTHIALLEACVKKDLGIKPKGLKNDLS